MPVLVQDRRGQRDPRKRPRARGAIMARPRCKPHRPFYFLWGNTASRASGPVVKVAAASRANAPVRKCGVKYQVSWWEQPDIPCGARIVYDTEGRVVDMVRGSLMHAARLGAGACAEVVYSCHNELSLSCITKHRLFCDAFWIISVAVVYRFCGHENKSIFAQRYCRKSPCAGTKHTNVRRAKTKTETTVKIG